MGILVLLIFVECSDKHENEPFNDHEIFYLKNKDKDFTFFKDIFIHPARGLYEVHIHGEFNVGLLLSIESKADSLLVRINEEAKDYIKLREKYNMTYEEILFLFTEIYKRYSELNVFGIHAYDHHYEFLFSWDCVIYYVPDLTDLDTWDKQHLKCDSSVERIYFDENWFMCECKKE
jgi:hypothetical protein